jgi:integrase
MNFGCCVFSLLLLAMLHLPQVPEPVTFETFAGRFRREYLPGRNLKRSTLIDYEGAIDRHLLPYFDSRRIAEITPHDLDRYIGDKSGELSPKTIVNHLGLLGVMFKVAKRWRLVAANPVDEVDWPRVEQLEIDVLSEAEVASLRKVYDERIAAAELAERPFWRLAKTFVFVPLATGARRGELLALRWRDLNLLEGLLRIREQYVRGEFTEPKSRKSRRTIELGPQTLELLADYFQQSTYTADDDLVFAHPLVGKLPIDPSKLGREYLRPALKQAGITKPFRTSPRPPSHQPHSCRGSEPRCLRDARRRTLLERDHRPLRPPREHALPWSGGNDRRAAVR